MTRKGLIRHKTNRPINQPIVHSLEEESWKITNDMIDKTCSLADLFSSSPVGSVMRTGQFGRVIRVVQGAITNGRRSSFPPYG